MVIVVVFVIECWVEIIVYCGYWLWVVCIVGGYIGMVGIVLIWDDFYCKYIEIFLVVVVGNWLKNGVCNWLCICGKLFEFSCCVVIC